MKSKFLFILFILSNTIFAEKWIQYGEHLIEGESIVIKLNKENAPMLGEEPPINFQSKFIFLDFLLEIGAEEILPLFYDFNNFYYL